MTTHAPPEPRWMSLPELAAATGLTVAQISQFVPATPTPEGPRFNPHQTALARVVRNLTDAGAPAAAIHTAVADLNQRPYADVLAAAPALRAVVRTGVGSDSVHLDAATAAGVSVSTPPGINAVAVAEYTMGLLLASARRLVPVASQVTAAGQAPPEGPHP